MFNITIDGERITELSKLRKYLESLARLAVYEMYHQPGSSASPGDLAEYLRNYAKQLNDVSVQLQKPKLSEKETELLHRCQEASQLLRTYAVQIQASHYPETLRLKDAALHEAFEKMDRIPSEGEKQTSLTTLLDTLKD